MNLLVIGGAGFVGSNFIRYILKKYPGYKVINLDKLTHFGNLNNLRDVEKDRRYAFVRGDVCDRGIVDKLAGRQPDAVINFAAVDSPEFIQTNILGTQVLLEAVKKHGLSCFLQVSTNVDDSLYSASKAGADLIVQSYHRAFNLPVLVVRSPDNYGFYQYPEKMIPFLIINFLQERKVFLSGDKQQKRDWIYALDNCNALDCVLHHGRMGEVYDVGANKEKTNLEVATLLLNLLDKDESLVEYVDNRKEKSYPAADSTKLRRLGWRPKYMFDEAMSDTIDWYIANQWWWKKLRDRF